MNISFATNGPYQYFMVIYIGIYINIPCALVLHDIKLNILLL